jgi:hypothetical protein
VVAFEHDQRVEARRLADRHPRAWLDAVLLQVLHELWVCLGFFRDALDDDLVAAFRAVKWKFVQSERAEAWDRITVWTRRRIAERLEEPRLDLWRNDVLDPVRLLVRFVPGHLEQVGEEALGEGVAANDILGGPAPVGGEEDLLARAVLVGGVTLSRSANRAAMTLHPSRVR